MKTENKKTLRGTILFTVVCVMALLIIFLTGTLALASAAGNRAHKSYSTSQANYTARAAIDSFATAMQRNDAIAAAVTQVGTNGLSQLNPIVEIKDKSLGEIGYFDSTGKWVKNRILVEPVADTGEYRYLDQDNDGVYEWIKTDAVKISATCKVGKEYETVTAFIQKLPYSSNPVNPGGINGLQEAGSSNFPNGALITGGLGVGIKEGDRDTSVYRTHNNQNIATTLTYINGSLVTGTGSTKWYVRRPTDVASAPTPYSATVIDGNLMLENDSFMVLDYTLPKGTELSQKEIPYLYVDGAFCLKNNYETTVNLVTKDAKLKETPPYNMFIGTLNVRGTINCNATLYLMDEPDGTNYDVKWVDRTGGKDTQTNSNTVAKGKNVFGTNSTSALYAWSSSVVQKTDTQFTSKAGSIYCKGDLTLTKCTIYGDVRVEGNCTVDNTVTIYGNLVVGKTLTGKPSFVGGQIYNNGAGGGGGKVTKPGYSYHKNELWPDIIKVDNLIYENTPVEDVEERSDHKMDHDPWHQEIEYPDGTVEDLGNQEPNCHKTIYIMPDKTTYYEKKPYYRTDEFGYDDKTTIVFDEYTRHKVDVNGNVIYQRDGAGQIITNGDGVQMTELSDSDYTYYRIPDAIGGEYTEVDEKDAYGDYYMKNGETKTCSESEATTNQGNSYTSIAQFYKDSNETSIYPTAMERKNIYGVKEDGEFKKGDSKTRIVKTLDEVRESLHADNKGKFDTTVYPNQIPDGLPYAYSGGKKTSVWEDGFITQSCILGDDTKKGSFTITEDINIKPANSDIWVVLQNITFSDDKGGDEIICHRSAGGNVKFMLDGVNSVNNAMIRTNDFKSDMTVNYNDTWNIEYFATAGAELNCTNNCTFVGTFKAPTLSMKLSNAGRVKVKYKDEYGVIHSNQLPVIVGSALVDHVEEATNNFSVLNSGNGGNAGNQSVFKANDAYWQLTYYMGV